MTTSGERLQVPDLDFEPPLCPLCNVHTATDGTSYWCEACGSTWEHDGTGGVSEAEYQSLHAVSLVRSGVAGTVGEAFDQMVLSGASRTSDGDNRSEP